MSDLNDICMPKPNKMKNYLYLAAVILFLGCSTEEDPAPQPGNEKEMPVAKADNLTAVENEEFTFEKSVLLENDTRVDNARITDFDTQTTEGGEIVDNRDGTLTYTPPQDFKGEDSFEYSLCVPGDSERCSEAAVKISVGDAGSPVAEDDSYEVQEDEEYSISNYLDNDVVIDNAVVTEVTYDGGNATVTFNQETGVITYLPNTSFSGDDSFTYTLCDDDETPNCSTGTITITVKDEGNPVANEDEVVVGNNVSEFVISNLLDNDVVIDGASIVSINDDDTSGNVSLNGDGTVTYSPNSGFEGEDSFTYTLCDDDSEATCVTATVTVNVVTPVAFNIPSGLEDYYSNVTFIQDAGLLYDVLSGFTSSMHMNRLEYTDRHDYLYDADEDPSNPANVILVYSGESRPEDEYWTGELDPWETFNTEHIYPQSYLDSEVAVGDLHLLRTADIDDNEARSNFPYTDGSGNYGLIGDDAWYPGDDWRGDVARMIMYVNLRYGEDFETVGNLQLFLEWNRVDPVSAFEMQRNNVIEAAQGNRNPFIDNPYLATLIWGGDAAENTWE